MDEETIKAINELRRKGLQIRNPTILQGAANYVSGLGTWGEFEDAIQQQCEAHLAAIEKRIADKMAAIRAAGDDE